MTTKEEKELAKERRKLLVDTNEQLWDRQDSERAFYQGHEYFDIHFLTDEVATCKLIECGMYVLVVEIKTKNGGKANALIPKHSIKMVVKREKDTQK